MNGNGLLQLSFGLTVTIAAYWFARRVHRRVTWLHPILTSAGLLMGLLLLGHIPLESYQAGADLLSILLGPATISLAIPIYKNRVHIKEHFKAIMISIACGAIVGVVSVAGIMYGLSDNHDVIISMLPKSVSSPIAVQIAQTIGAVPELAAVYTVFTGLVGGLVGTSFLRKMGFVDDVSIGIAMGTASHALGTARCLSESETQGTFSGLAMGMMGIMTSALFAILLVIFGQ